MGSLIYQTLSQPQEAWAKLRQDEDGHYIPETAMEPEVLHGAME